MKQIIEDIGRTTYRELQKAVMDRDELKSVEIIEPIQGLQKKCTIQ